MTVKELADLVLSSGPPDAEVEVMVTAPTDGIVRPDHGYAYDGVVVLCGPHP